MSNITLSLDENTYRTARIVAAERGMSVSALVRTYLQSLKPDSQAADREELIRTLDWAASTGQFSASERLSRDEVHDRAAIRDALSTKPRNTAP